MDLQLKRGTTAKHSTFTGKVGEVTVDTDKDTVVVHDGTTAGGFPMARESVVTTALEGKVDKVAGKQLSSEDYTSLEKSKLAGIESGAQVNTVNSVSGKTGAVTLTKSDVGLSNVDNTSDLSKPISTATQTSLDGKVDKVTGKGLSANDYTDLDKAKLLGIESGAQVNTVTSVAGKTGVVTLSKNDVGLSNVDNTSDANKPISNAVQTALNTKVDKVTSTDNAIVRFDGTTGAVQNSGVVIDDNGNIGVSGSYYPNITLTNINSSSTFPLIALQDLRTNAHSWNIEAGRRGSALSFRDNNASDGVYERMRIDSSGNVEVGATPSGLNGLAKLIVNQPTSGVENLALTNKTNDAYTYMYNDGSAFVISNSYNTTAGYKPIVFQTGGSERMRIDANGNVGIGVVPSAWSGFKALQQQNTSISSNLNEQYMTSNGYYNGSNWIYNSNTGASQYLNNQGIHTWKTAPSGTAGNAITWTTVMTVDSSGNLRLNSPTGGIGYGTGAGGTVTQLTSKSTAVTLNKPTGVITMNNAALAAGESVHFALNNTLITYLDQIVYSGYYNTINPQNYRFETDFAVYGAVVIRVTNISNISLSEAVQFNFSVIKGAQS